jgi:hypothetical protein
VPYGPRRATKENEDANCRSNGISNLDRVFKGVPYGPRRATNGNEDVRKGVGRTPWSAADAPVGLRPEAGLPHGTKRVFRGAVFAEYATMFLRCGVRVFNCCAVHPMGDNLPFQQTLAAEEADWPGGVPTAVSRLNVAHSPGSQ